MDDNEESLHRFAWLFAQVITLPSDLACRNTEQASELLDDLLLKTSYPIVKSIAQNISSVIRGTSTSTADPTVGPGGRHSHDLVDFREISIVPTADEAKALYLHSYARATRSINRETRIHERWSTWTTYSGFSGKTCCTRCGRRSRSRRAVLRVANTEGPCSMGWCLLGYAPETSRGDRSGAWRSPAF